MKKTIEIIPTRINDLLVLKKMTMAELARQSGLSVNTLARIFRGEGSTTILTLSAIANTLGVSVAFLVEDESVEHKVFNALQIIKAIIETQKQDLIHLIDGLYS